MHKRKKRPETYRVRHYRKGLLSEGLLSAHVQIKETDLHIQSDVDVQRRAEELVLESRLQIEEHIVTHPLFYSSLSPLQKDFSSPPLVKEMYDAARLSGVGPMAAVAGAIAEYVGKKLLEEGAGEIIIENGGDIFIHKREGCTISIFAGQSPLSEKIGIVLPAPMPWGVCTSSGTVGHSLSLGKADSVTVVARSTALADAAATRLGNIVAGGKDTQDEINTALALAKSIEGLTGVVVICGETMGAVGDIELVQVEANVV